MQQKFNWGYVWSERKILLFIYIFIKLLGMSNYTKTEFGSKMLNVNIYELLNEINNKTTKNKRRESVE